MAVVGDILFHRNDRVDLDAALRHQLNSVSGMVDKVPNQEFSAKSDQDIIEKIVNSLTIEPLTLHLDKATPHVEEAKVLITDDFRFHLPNGPIEVAGLRATKTIPFSGEEDLWHLCPNTRDFNPPYGLIKGRTLVVGVTVRSEDADDAKKHIDETLAKVPIYIERQQGQLQAFNDAVPGLVTAAVQQRRARLNQASDLLGKL